MISKLIRTKLRKIKTIITKWYCKWWNEKSNNNRNNINKINNYKIIPAILGCWCLYTSVHLGPNTFIISIYSFVLLKAFGGNSIESVEFRAKKLDKVIIID
jgi:hypothetical protein